MQTIRKSPIISHTKAWLGIALGVSSSCGAPQNGPTRAAAPPSLVATPPTAAASATPPVFDVPGCAPRGATEPPIRFLDDKMTALCRDLYVEPAFTLGDREHAAREYVAARESVARELGALESPPPLALLCKTEACAEYFGGMSRRSRVIGPGDRQPGATYVGGSRPTILVLRPGGVIAHETVHVELHFRLRAAFLPTWFDEGLATLVSGEPDCNGQKERGIDDLRRLNQGAAWNDYTNTRNTLRATYCQARAEVGAWVRRSGKQKLFDLLDKVRDGSPFDEVYGSMQTQGSGPVPTVLVSSAPRLGEGDRPFSLAMWIKPAAPAGVLAHVSETPVGTGWCVPFLGYDAQKRIVSQIVQGISPDPSSFAVTVDTKPRALGRWMHIAMTWAPGSGNRLYVDGTLAAEVKAPRYEARGAGAPMSVAWGSSNVGGASCWQGAIAPGAFQGSIAGMRVYDTELGAADVAALARASP